MKPFEGDYSEFETLLDEIPHATSSTNHPHDVLESRMHHEIENLNPGGDCLQSLSSQDPLAPLVSGVKGLSIDSLEGVSYSFWTDEFRPSSRPQMMGGHGDRMVHWPSWVVGKNTSVLEKPNGEHCGEDLCVLSDSSDELGVREFEHRMGSSGKANETSGNLGMKFGDNNHPRTRESLECLHRGRSNLLDFGLNAEVHTDYLNRNLNWGGLPLLERLTALNNMNRGDGVLQSEQDATGLYVSHLPFFFDDSLKYNNATTPRRFGGNSPMLFFQNLTQSVGAADSNLFMMSNVQNIDGFSEKNERYPNNKDVGGKSSDGWSILLGKKVDSSKNCDNACSNFYLPGARSDESFELGTVSSKSGRIPWSLYLNYAAAFLPPRDTSLQEIEGYLYLVAKDQQGCRFLQRMLDQGTPQEVRMIFNEISGHAAELMMDRFGNYLIQKLLLVCTELQRNQIILVLTSKTKELANISSTRYGTRVVQKLIETLKTPYQIAMVVSSLEQWVVDLVKDPYGHHVVDSCLKFLSNEDNKFLFNASAEHCVEIATHATGCLVMQQCVDHSNGIHQRHLITEIAANALILSQDAYGNYVVQRVLNLKSQWATESINFQLQGNYLNLSVQKFSSNVVEICLKQGGEAVRLAIIHELMSSSNFEQLLQDQYANYVIQSALATSKGAVRDILVKAIRPFTPALHNNPFGKGIISRINPKRCTKALVVVGMSP